MIIKKIVYSLVLMIRPEIISMYQEFSEQLFY